MCVCRERSKWTDCCRLIFLDRHHRSIITFIPAVQLLCIRFCLFVCSFVPVGADDAWLGQNRQNPSKRRLSAYCITINLVSDMNNRLAAFFRLLFLPTAYFMSHNEYRSLPFAINMLHIAYISMWKLSVGIDNVAFVLLIVCMCVFVRFACRNIATKDSLWWKINTRLYPGSSYP